MIHAYITTQNIQDNDDHGDEFCKHMERINQLGRCNISIHHDFRDEVNVYSDLWWRCDGPCQAKEPFLGYEVAPTNRQAPSVSSLRKSKHDKTCGGQYTKVPKPDYGFLKGKVKKIS
ncbi:DNA-dependent metalloprotease SPRTN-like [Bombina bombina]|uniref:DNA-dependent metalloprotease SPRTN-like n=1 Tax=Bombina bombina TaxID=8345 RepID=UPI00235A62FD|nr:DNA-dependent metalloprotease SPRTN-like [Bombina bombina]